MKITRKRLIILTLGAVLFLVIGAFAAQPSPTESMTNDTVKRQDLIQTVEVTGRVESVTEADLAFGASGVVGKMLVKVGDTVKAGQLLASLTAGDLQASYAQALQSVAQAQADLDLKRAGISSSATAVSQADVDAALVALDQANLDLERTKQETADELVQAKENLVEDLRALVSEVRQSLASADTVLGVENSLYNNDFDEILGAQDVSSVARAVDAFEQAMVSRDRAEADLATMQGADADPAIRSARAAYEDAYDVLAATSRVLDATSANTDALTLDELTTLKSTIASAQASLVADGSALLSAEQAVDDAALAIVLDVADAEAVVAARHVAVQRAEASLLDATEAPRDVELAGYEAALARARAGVTSALARLAETRIVSPLSGIVTAVEVQAGEAASALTPMISVLASGDQYKITLDLPEADIAKVQVGQTADVTFDAFGDDLHFTATVTAIDPAEQLIQDVVFYKATVLLDPTQDLSGLKPGLSANVTITTATRTAVLTVPSRSVLENDGVKYVRVPEGESYRQQTVEVGLRADGGLMEIISGLSEGETVIVSIKAL